MLETPCPPASPIRRSDLPLPIPRETNPWAWSVTGSPLVHMAAQVGGPCWSPLSKFVSEYVAISLVVSSLLCCVVDYMGTKWEG